MQNGDQPIHIAAGQGNVGIVKALIEQHKVDPAAKSKVILCYCSIVRF